MTLSQKCCRGTVQTTMSHVCSHSNSYNWRHHVRSSLKDALNSSVLICRLNAMYESKFWQMPAEHSRPAQRPLEMLDCQVSFVVWSHPLMKDFTPHNGTLLQPPDIKLWRLLLPVNHIAATNHNRWQTCKMRYQKEYNNSTRTKIKSRPPLNIRIWSGHQIPNLVFKRTKRY